MRAPPSRSRVLLPASPAPWSAFPDDGEQHGVLAVARIGQVRFPDVVVHFRLPTPVPGQLVVDAQAIDVIPVVLLLAQEFPLQFESFEEQRDPGSEAVV